MLALLDVGFLIFLFVPPPGRGVTIPPHVPPERFEYPRWYPTNIAEIVEGSAKPPKVDGVKSPVRAVAPVPVVVLVLLFAIAVVFYPSKNNKEKWQNGEVERLTEIYRSAEKEFKSIEATLDKAGTDGKRVLYSEGKWGRGSKWKVWMISKLDSIARAHSKYLRPLYQVGIQVFTQEGKRCAWGGNPHYVDVRLPFRSGVRHFNVKTTLYTMLVRVEDIPHVGRVVVDVPLEVNYRINNRFLRSTSLDEYLTQRYGRDVDFEFSMGEHRGYAPWFKSDGRGDSLRVVLNPKGAIKVYGFLMSSEGLPLARLAVTGEPYVSYLESQRERKAFISGVLILTATLVLSVWIYTLYGKKSAEEGRKYFIALRRGVLLVALIILLRFILLKLNLPSIILESSVFDPSLFADDFPGGLMRTAGDFMISALFSLILVFGLIKVYRTYYKDYLERNLDVSRGVSLWRVLLKGVLIFIVLYISGASIGYIVNRVVLNSNPRLIGFDVDYFSFPFLLLHTAILFTVTAIVVAAVFLVRLIVLILGRGLVDSIFASLIAIGGMAFVSQLDVLTLVVSAGVIFLSIKIFSTLRKEDVMTVIFGAFFLLIVVTLYIYGVAENRYGELRDSRIEEKAIEFSSPEDNWLKVVLPDICNDIARNRLIIQKVKSKKESLAFEIWAESPLSRLNLSCAFSVYGVDGKLLSKFKVGIPFELGRMRRGVEGSGLKGTERVSGRAGEITGLELPEVFNLRSRTQYGVVYYYLGVVPIRDFRGRLVGRVEVEIPYFFEDTALLARSGPMAPEIFHNLEKGAVAPRIDEPEDMLVARVVGGVVADASIPSMPRVGLKELGFERRGKWLHIGLDKDTYRCVVNLDEEGDGYLVGYRVSSLLEKLLQWAGVFSVDMILTLLSFLVLFVISRMPVLKGVVPAVAPSGSVGFKQKLLLSFLLISVVPVVVIGLFSGKVIENRYAEETRKEALFSVREALKVTTRSVELEAEAVVSSIESGVPVERCAGDLLGNSDCGFVLFDVNGKVQKVISLCMTDSTALRAMAELEPQEGIRILDCGRKVFVGLTKELYREGARVGKIFYARKLDDDFLRGVADVLSREVNIYTDGLLSATSERELFTGGFIEPILTAGIFRDISLGLKEEVVSRESLGDYSYSVASIPVPSLASSQMAVLSVPLLYRPEALLKEYRRSSALMLGLLSLLFASTVTLGVFLAGKIFNPIAALREGTRRIIEGDLEFALTSSAPDEIGELVSSFNRMTEALRKAREELVERQRYLSAVLENIGTGVIATDSTGKIIAINPAGQRILSIDEDELRARHAGEIEDESLKPLIGLLYSFRHGGVYEREVELVRGGERITVRAVVAELEAGGKKLGTVMVFDDLTELIRSKKLSAWVEMARQIAHEVKNPLTPIKLSAQFMKRAFRDRSSDFDKIFTEGIETIITQAEILRRIATEFSSFGKVIRVKPEVFEVEGFLQGFVTTYRGAEGVDISYRSSCEKVRAFADREALRKIMVNLMENALEAMQGGGSVEILCGVKGEKVMISVIDSGPGLSEEVMEHLFEPYFSTKTNGTGLGLAISQSLAEEMGGKVFLRNREGARGVEATVEIPVYKGDKG